MNGRKSKAIRKKSIEFVVEKKFQLQITKIICQLKLIFLQTINF